MEHVKYFFKVVTGIASLGLIIWGVYAGILKLFVGFASLNPNVAAAIVAGSVTVAISLSTIIITRQLESRALIRKEHREKKIPVYEELISFMLRVVMGEKLANSPTEKETIEFFSGFTQRFMIWGSDPVLKAFVKFRLKLLNLDKDKAHELLFLYGKLILEIRRDLGHKNKNINDNDVLSLWINDLDIEQ